MRKLPAKAAMWLLPLILTGFMTIIVSGISTARAVGFGPATANLWFASWIWSWAVAFPTMLVVMPLARRLVAAMTEASGRH
jgi:hypothetical protein